MTFAVTPVAAPARKRMAGKFMGLTVSGTVPLTRTDEQEQFEEGLTPYTLTSGTLARFSVGSSAYGATVACAVSSVATSDIVSKPVAVAGVSRITFKVRVPAFSGTASAPYLCFKAGAATIIRFTPRVRNFFDGSQRPQLTINAEARVFTPGAMTVNTWYSVEILVAPGANQSSMTIRDAVSGALLGSGSVLFTSSHNRVALDSMTIERLLEQATSTPSAEYADIRVWSTLNQTSEDTKLVRVLDIRGPGVTVTRGVGENAHVLTIKRPIPLSAVRLLLFFTESTFVDYAPSPISNQHGAVDGGGSISSGNYVASVTSTLSPYGEACGAFSPGYNRAASLNSQFGTIPVYSWGGKLSFDYTGEWAIDFWYRLASVSTPSARGGWILNVSGFGYAFTNGGPSSVGARGHHSIWCNPDGSLRFFMGVGNNPSPPGSPPFHQEWATSDPVPLDTWIYGCVSQKAGVVRIHQQGSLKVEAARTINPSPASGSYYAVGGGPYNQSTPATANNSLGVFCGYMAGFRVTAGYHRTGALPTEKFPITRGE